MEACEARWHWSWNERQEGTRWQQRRQVQAPEQQQEEPVQARAQRQATRAQQEAEATVPPPPVLEAPAPALPLQQRLALRLLPAVPLCRPVAVAAEAAAGGRHRPSWRGEWRGGEEGERGAAETTAENSTAQPQRTVSERRTGDRDTVTSRGTRASMHERREHSYDRRHTTTGTAGTQHGHAQSRTQNDWAHRHARSRAAEGFQR